METDYLKLIERHAKTMTSTRYYSPFSFIFIDKEEHDLCIKQLEEHFSNKKRRGKLAYSGCQVLLIEPDTIRDIIFHANGQTFTHPAKYICGSYEKGLVRGIELESESDYWGKSNVILVKDTPMDEVWKTGNYTKSVDLHPFADKRYRI